MAFINKLRTGKATEGVIATYLRSQGHTVMPIYEIPEMSSKGPQIFTPDGELIAPDLLVFSDKGIRFLEAKHKSHFTWHRKTQQWVTGIDVRHYMAYLEVMKVAGLSIWLVFFHDSSTPSDDDLKAGCPAECPTGLFCGDIFKLQHSENHRWPPEDGGMVYWNLSALQLRATRHEVLRASENA